MKPMPVALAFLAFAAAAIGAYIWVSGRGHVLTEARDAWSRGDRQAALDAYAVVAEEPAHEIEAGTRRAALLFEKDRVEEAAAALAEPTSDAARVYAAGLALHRGDLEAAKTYVAAAESDEDARIIAALITSLDDRAAAHAALSRLSEARPLDPRPTLLAAALGGGSAGLDLIASGEDWSATIAQFLSGQLAHQSMLTAAYNGAPDYRTQRNQTCEGFAYAMMKAEHDGHDSVAGHHARSAREAKVFGTIPCWWAAYRLEAANARNAPP